LPGNAAARLPANARKGHPHLLHSGENGPDMSLTQVASAFRLNKSTVHGFLPARQKFLHARMKIDLVKTFAAKLSKLFSRGPRRICDQQSAARFTKSGIGVISHAEAVPRRSHWQFSSAI
jgi:hypothetical protein